MKESEIIKPKFWIESWTKWFCNVFIFLFKYKVTRTSNKSYSTENEFDVFIQ